MKGRRAPARPTRNVEVVAPVRVRHVVNAGANTAEAIVLAAIKAATISACARARPRYGTVRSHR